MQAETQERMAREEEFFGARVARALVSVGAAAAIVAVAALVFGRWSELGAWGQVGVLAGFTVCSAGAGAWLLARDSEPLQHAGNVVWMTTVALVYGTATAITKNFDVVPSGLTSPQARAFPWVLRAVPAFVASVMLLARQRRTPQAIAFVASLVATAVSTYSVVGRLTPASIGMVIAGAGAVTLLLAWLDQLGPRIEAESMAVGLIAFGTMLPDFGRPALWAPVVGAAIGATMVATSVPMRSAAARVFGIVMTATFLLQATFQVFRSPFALLATGAILIAGGLAVARMLRKSTHADVTEDAGEGSVPTS